VSKRKSGFSLIDGERLAKLRTRISKTAECHTSARAGKRGSVVLVSVN